MSTYLRPRLLLLLVLLSPMATEQSASAQLTVPSVFDRMQNHSITSATVITHGFTTTDSGGGYMLPLANAIRDELLSQSGGNVWLLDYDVADDGATGTFNESNSRLPAIGSVGQSGHAILLYDWAPESNETSRWWAESAGDALFSLGTGVGMFDVGSQAATPTQFIAHSFGSVVTTEAVERLAGYNYPVSQVTLIDPHDFDQADVPTFDDAQRLFDLGQPDGYGATLWNNVAEADVYYQTRGNQGGLAALVTADPEGRPIPGAYNRLLDDGQTTPPTSGEPAELPTGNPYGFFSADSDHGYAWNTFYTASVTGTLPVGSASPAGGNAAFANTGWAHSIHNTNRVAIPENNFYSNRQDHEHTEPELADANGSPNPVGLQDLGLTEQELVDARWAPEFAPGDVANGDFEAGNRTSATVDLVAGWSHHGGGGDSEILSESTSAGDNRFLRLDSNDVERTHNHHYFAADAETIQFDLRVPNSSIDDELQVFVGDLLLEAIELTAVINDWTRQIVTLPTWLRDTVNTFSIALSFGNTITDSPEIDFDNFQVGLVALEGDFNRDGVVDAADYTVWRAELGQLYTENDYKIWRTNFGSTLTAPSMAAPGYAIPEPQTMALLTLAMGGMLSYRQPRLSTSTIDAVACLR